MPVSSASVFNGLALLQEQNDFLASSRAADINTTTYLKIKLAAQHKRTAQRNQYGSHPSDGGSEERDRRPVPPKEERQRSFSGGGVGALTPAETPVGLSGRAPCTKSVDSAMTESSAERRRSSYRLEREVEESHLPHSVEKKVYRDNMEEEGGESPFPSSTVPHVGSTTSSSLSRLRPKPLTDPHEMHDMLRMEGEKEPSVPFAGVRVLPTKSNPSSLHALPSPAVLNSVPPSLSGSREHAVLSARSIAEMELTSSRLAALAEQKERQRPEIRGGQTPLDISPSYSVTGNESMPAVSSRRALQVEKEGLGPSSAAPIPYPHHFGPRFSGVQEGSGGPLAAQGSLTSFSGEPWMTKDGPLPSSSSAVSAATRHAVELVSRTPLDTPNEDGSAGLGTAGSRSHSSGSRRGTDHHTRRVDPLRLLKERGMDSWEREREVDDDDETGEGRRRGPRGETGGGGASRQPLEATQCPIPSVSPFSPLHTKPTTLQRTPLSPRANDAEEEASESPVAQASLGAHHGRSGGAGPSDAARHRPRDLSSFTAFQRADSDAGTDGMLDSAPRQRMEDSHQELTSSTSVLLDRVPAVATGEMLFSEGPEVVDVTLVPCDCCGRRFAEDRLPRHREACEKQKKREWIRHKNTRAAHTAQHGHLYPPHKGGSFSGGAGAEYGSFGGGEPYYGGGGNANGSSPSSNVRAKGKGDWRKQSLHLRGALNGVDLVDDDRVACPHCHRRFAAETAARHVPLCRERGDGKLHNFNN